MAAVLTGTKIIKCSHSGQGITAPMAKLTVSGKHVLTKADVLAATGFVGCTNIPPPMTKVPCSGVSSVSAGELTKLTVGGVKAVGDGTMGVTNSTPSGTIVIATPQMKLTAV